MSSTLPVLDLTKSLFQMWSCGATEPQWGQFSALPLKPVVALSYLALESGLLHTQSLNTLFCKPGKDFSVMLCLHLLHYLLFEETPPEQFLFTLTL
jgi:hypothetical protein